MERTINNSSKIRSIFKLCYDFIEFKTKSIFKKSGFARKKEYNHNPVDAPIAKEVEEYYNKETATYLEAYGKIIQAARPSSDTDFISYLSKSMGLIDGMHVLDAGCGVCGPAVEFVKQKKITIEAITISEVQVIKSRQHISENHLNGYINVVKGDYSDLHKLYPANTFDLVFFLETLGYANDLQRVLTSASSVLKQGGSIYIKDFFTVPIIDPEKRKTQHEFVKTIRKEYLYRVLNIATLIPILTEIGLYIEFIKPIDVAEDFTKASDFEIANISHSIYTKAITNPFRLFEVLEVKFKKVYD